MHDLELVYQIFDLDKSGEVGFQEMLTLGQARRSLGHKKGEWTHEMNERMMDRMGIDHNGDVPMKNFVTFFEGVLPIDDDEFDRIIADFTACAMVCNDNKEGLSPSRRHSRQGSRPPVTKGLALTVKPALVCVCGNTFMEDSNFCRKCGKKRPVSSLPTPHYSPVTRSPSPSPPPWEEARSRSTSPARVMSIPVTPTDERYMDVMTPNPAARVPSIPVSPFEERYMDVMTPNPPNPVLPREYGSASPSLGRSLRDSADRYMEVMASKPTETEDEKIKRDREEKKEILARKQAVEEARVRKEEKKKKVEDALAAQDARMEAAKKVDRSPATSATPPPLTNRIMEVSCSSKHEMNDTEAASPGSVGRRREDRYMEVMSPVKKSPVKNNGSETKSKAQNREDDLRRSEEAEKEAMRVQAKRAKMEDSIKAKDDRLEKEEEEEAKKAREFAAKKAAIRQPPTAAPSPSPPAPVTPTQSTPSSGSPSGASDPYMDVMSPNKESTAEKAERILEVRKRVASQKLEAEKKRKQEKLNEAMKEEKFKARESIFKSAETAPQRVDMTGTRKSPSSPGDDDELTTARFSQTPAIVSAESRQQQVDRKAMRIEALREVYQIFDLDHSGEVGFDEMLTLGRARRSLGQKKGEWTYELNERMMERMGTDDNGDVPMENFVTFFESSLTYDDPGFKSTMEQFRACARECNKRKAHEDTGGYKTPDTGGYKAPTEQTRLEPMSPIRPLASSTRIPQPDRDDFYSPRQAPDSPWGTPYVAPYNNDTKSEDIDALWKAIEELRKELSTVKAEAKKAESDRQKEIALLKEQLRDKKDKGAKWEVAGAEPIEPIKTVDGVGLGSFDAANW